MSPEKSALENHFFFFWNRHVKAQFVIPELVARFKVSLTPNATHSLRFLCGQGLWIHPTQEKWSKIRLVLSLQGFFSPSFRGSPSSMLRIVDYVRCLIFRQVISYHEQTKVILSWKSRYPDNDQVNTEALATVPENIPQHKTTHGTPLNVEWCFYL